MCLQSSLQPHLKWMYVRETGEFSHRSLLLLTRRVSYAGCKLDYPVELSVTAVLSLWGFSLLPSTSGPLDTVKTKTWGLTPSFIIMFIMDNIIHNLDPSPKSSSDIKEENRKYWLKWSQLFCSFRIQEQQIITCVPSMKTGLLFLFVLFTITFYNRIF